MIYGQALILSIIVETVNKNLAGSRVVLFGSQARGEAGNLSDYDLLIISPTTLTSKQKIFLSSRLDRELVKAVNVPIDLLLSSEAEVLVKEQMPGHIIRSAIRDGIAL